MSKTTIVVEHAGIAYSAEVATIKSTFLGIEDHGIMTAQLNLEWSGPGISSGGWSLDRPIKVGGTQTVRIGSAFGMDQVMAIMKTVGVSQWEKLPGRDVLALFRLDGPYGSTVGIASITKQDTVLVYAEHSELFKEKDKL